MPSIKVKKLSPQATLPRYAHTGPQGDLAADLYSAEDTSLLPGETKAISTGVSVEFPNNYGGIVHDRSGIALKGVTTLAGVIDCGYRGEIKVVMANLSKSDFPIKPGDRIAQMRIVQRIEAEFIESSDVDETARGSGGFGSTGK
jgi:dUTP pyrophosphatase